MERHELRAVLEAGPSRRFNALEITRGLEGEPGASLLFRLGFLNRAIFLKHLERRRGRRAGASTTRLDRPADMLIYLPFDPARPFDGGQSLIYSRQTLRALQAARSGADPRATPSEAVQHDEAILDVLDELPALNPFLLREAFARAGKTVPDAYVAVDAAVAERLQRRLRQRVRPLVVAAFAGHEGAGETALDTLVDGFLRPAQSGELAVLGGALGLDAADAPEVLSAWAGIAFFEDETIRLKPEIKAFASWLASADDAPRGPTAAPTGDLRTSVREAWGEIRATLEAYQTSYHALVFESEPTAFVGFLRRCRDSYWRMGDLIGRFEQAVNTWRLATGPFARQTMPEDVRADLLACLARTFHAAAEHPAAQTPVRAAG